MNYYSYLSLVHPATKSYFAHWPDLSPGFGPVMKHGKIIIMAVGEAVGKIDDLIGGLGDLHATKMGIDPNNFKVGKINYAKLYY